eukprot:gene8390-215_t
MVNLDHLELEEENLQQILKTELNLREKFLGNYYLVGTYGRRNNLEKAIQHGLKCLEISKKENVAQENIPLAQVYASLGELYFKKEDYENSIDMYKQVLKIDPNNLLVLNSLLNTCFFSGDFFQGLEVVEKISNVQNGITEELIIKKAHLLEKMTKFKDAEKCFKEGLENHPESRFLLKHFATFYHNINDKEHFNMCLDEYKKLIPNEQYDLDIVIHLLNSGNFEEAFEFLDLIPKNYLKNEIENDIDLSNKKEIILGLLFQWSEKIGISIEEDVKCLNFIDEFSNNESQRLIVKVNKIKRKIYDDNISILEDLKQATELVKGSLENALICINYSDKLHKDHPEEAIQYLKYAFETLSQIENLQFQDTLNFKFFLDPIIFLIDKNENSLAFEFIDICQKGFGEKYFSGFETLKGYNHFYKRNFDEALNYFEKVKDSKIIEDPFRSVNFMLAVIYFEKQDYKLVIEHGENSLELFPNLIPDKLYEILSISFEKLGNKEKSEFYKNQISQ